MDKSVIGLVVAIGAVTPFAGAQAVTTDEANRALEVNSIAELLEPAPNAVAILNALAAEPKTGKDADVEVAQFFYHHHHHHHYYHHHHFYHHHHHYHHHMEWCLHHPYAC